MTETADHLPEPDLEIVGNIAAALAHAPSDKVGRLLEKTLERLYFGARFKGWGHAPAADFAATYGHQIRAAIQAGPLISPAGARLH